jgi:predicted ATPase with chaperone activity
MESYATASHDAYDASAKSPKATVLSDFDTELERFEKIVMGFADRLDSVLNQYARQEVSEQIPRPEASSAIRGRIERLRDVAAKFDRLLADIDL